MKANNFTLYLATLLILLAVTKPADADNYGFDGEAADGKTQIINLRARYYDPETGSFTAKDPLGVQGSLNGYLFATANPVNNVDPLGLQVPGPINLVVGFGPGYGESGQVSVLTIDTKEAICEIGSCRANCEWNMRGQIIM